MTFEFEGKDLPIPNPQTIFLGQLPATDYFPIYMQGRFFDNDMVGIFTHSFAEPKLSASGLPVDARVWVFKKDALNSFTETDHPLARALKGRLSWRDGKANN